MEVLCCEAKATISINTVDIRLSRDELMMLLFFIECHKQNNKISVYVEELYYKLKPLLILFNEHD